MSAARIMNCTPEEEKEFVNKEKEKRSAHLNWKLWITHYNVLSELNIDELYKAVVEFIKDHNLKQDKPLKLSGEMIDVGLLSVEEETIFFWDDFNNSRKKK